MPRAVSYGSERAKLTENEKADKQTATVMVSLLKKFDAAGLERIISNLSRDLRVFKQEGDGAGRRFSGAENHSYASNVEAYGDTVTRGMIPKAN